MSTTYTVTANVKCWKKHECVDCGCEFRYKFNRTIQGTGNSEKAAHASANKNVEATLRQQVDVRPCPSCGRIQPDMIGQVRAANHSIVGWVTMSIVSMFVVLGATYVLGASVAPFIVAIVLAAAAVVNLLIAIRNPNSDLEANRSGTEKSVRKGEVEITEEGKTSGLEKPPHPMGIPHWIGIGAGALAALVVLTPVICTSFNGLKTNRESYPQVVSPGDAVTVYFDDSIDCVKSYWSGSPLAKITNAADLGIAEGMSATSKNSTWGGNISVKSSEKHTKPSIWATLALPSDAKLAKQTIRVRVNMNVRFPNADASDRFNDQNKQMSKEFEIAVSPPGASAKYGTIWWLGMVGGSLLSVGSCFYLRSLAKSLQAHAIPPDVESIADEEKDDDADEDDDE